MKAVYMCMTILTVVLVTLWSHSVEAGIMKTTMPNCYGLTCPEGTVSCKRIITNDQNDPKILVKKVMCVDRYEGEKNSVVTTEKNPSGALIYMASSKSVYMSEFSGNEGGNVHTSISSNNNIDDGLLA